MFCTIQKNKVIVIKTNCQQYNLKIHQKQVQQKKIKIEL